MSSVSSSRFSVPVFPAQREKPPPLSNSEYTWSDAMAPTSKVKQQAAKVLKVWIEERKRDFESETNKALLCRLIDEIQKEYPSEAEELQIVYETTPCRVYTPPTYPLPPRSFLQPDSFDAREVALSITLYEFYLFKNVQEKELLFYNSKKKKDEGGEEGGLPAVVEFSNLVLKWVVSEIVQQVYLKDRVKIVINFIKLCDELLQFNNFSSFKSVLGGLSSAACHRLKKTWDEVPQELQERYQNNLQIMSYQANYSAYRSRLRISKPPIIPYIGIYLSDLTFIDDGNPDESLGLVNLKKAHMIAKILQKVNQYQSFDYKDYYNIEEYDMLGGLQKCSLLMSEDELFTYSNLIEPKDHEKAIASLFSSLQKAQRELSLCQTQNESLRQVLLNEKENTTWQNSRGTVTNKFEEKK